MSNEKVVRLDDHRKRLDEDGFPVFNKVLDDGTVAECIDVDALTPSERARFWRLQDAKAALTEKQP